MGGQQPVPKQTPLQRAFSRFDEPIVDPVNATPDDVLGKVEYINIPDEPTPEIEVEEPPPQKKRGRKPNPVAPKSPVTESRSTDGLPSYRCEFSGRDIFVGFPWYKTTNPVTSFAMLALALDFGRDNIRFDLSMGDAMIYHSRNRLAAKFLETDAKWLLMIDDDIIPSIGRPAWFRNWVRAAGPIPDLALQRHVLHRLIGANKTLVGGAYFGRQEGAPIMCSDYSLAPRARAYEDSVVPVDWVGTGCILIPRKVLEDIRAKFPELKLNKEDTPFDFFRPISSEHGEDVSFCKRANAAGHQTHIDLGLPVFHVGAKCY
jgi:hypothetical protein